MLWATARAAASLCTSFSVNIRYYLVAAVAQWTVHSPVCTVVNVLFSLLTRAPGRPRQPWVPRNMGRKGDRLYLDRIIPQMLIGL